MTKDFRTIGLIAAGLILSTWPLWVPASEQILDTSAIFQTLILGFLPLLLLLHLKRLLNAQTSTRIFTILAALTAVAMVVRILGAGVAGVEPIWTVVILSGLALGAESGFIVGVSALLLSAVATGGIGPWLPYQTLAAGSLGAIAGLFSTRKIRNNSYFLASIGFLAGMFFGWIMNLWFWPGAIGLLPEIAFDPNAEPLERLANWMRFNLITSLGFDLPRAILTSGLLFTIGPRLILAIERSARTGRITTPAELNKP